MSFESHPHQPKVELDAELPEAVEEKIDLLFGESKKNATEINAEMQAILRELKQDFRTIPAEKKGELRQQAQRLAETARQADKTIGLEAEEATFTEISDAFSEIIRLTK